MLSLVKTPPLPEAPWHGALPGRHHNPLSEFNQNFTEAGSPDAAMISMNQVINALADEAIESEEIEDEEDAIRRETLAVYAAHLQKTAVYIEKAKRLATTLHEDSDAPDSARIIRDLIAILETTTHLSICLLGEVMAPDLPIDDIENELEAA